MEVIIKIVIKGASGYCCVDEAYNDKVTITPESISYEYIPAVLLTSEDFKEEDEEDV